MKTFLVIATVAFFIVLIPIGISIYLFLSSLDGTETDEEIEEKINAWFNNLDHTNYL